MKALCIKSSGELQNTGLIKMGKPVFGRAVWVHEFVDNDGFHHVVETDHQMCSAGSEIDLDITIGTSWGKKDDNE